jgi:hypothetical protein
MVFGYDGQFDTNVTDITYYFSAITSHANPSSYYPCQFEGCWNLIGSGDTNTNYFYSSYLADPTSAGTCSDCGTIYHSGDPIYDVNSGCCFDSFCLYTEYTPFSGYDGNYVSAGTYDGYSYFTGGSDPGFIYYSTGDTSWCLSSSLGGSCSLFGAKPCYNPCPDICDELFGGNICPTPTPSPTINCSLNDFSALFDCDVQPTPTPTPTVTSSPTPTPTITPTINPCNLVDALFTVNSFSPTPTPTPSVTPAPYTPPFDCFISGNVTFNTFTDNIVCPDGNRTAVYMWEDCNSGSIYLTDLLTYSGGSYSTGDTFFAQINGVNGCVRFLDVTGGSINTYIRLIEFAGIDCSFCSAIVPSPTPSPTMTMTPTVTPTMTMTPTPSNTPQSITKKWFIFRLCGRSINGSQIIAMDVPNALLLSLNINAGLGFSLQYGTNSGSLSYSDPTLPFIWSIWEFVDVVNANQAQLNAYLITNYSPIDPNFPIIYNGDFFTDNGIVAYNPTLPTLCSLGVTGKLNYPIYIFTNCKSGPGGEAIFLFQYPPFDTFPLSPGEIIRYDDGINEPCWEFGYNGVTTIFGILSSLSVPSTPLLTGSGVLFTLPAGYSAVQHSYADFFYDTNKLSGPFGNCTDCLK